MIRDDDQDITTEASGLAAGRHLGRIAIVAVYAALLLGWLATHTSVLFADGLRYVAQAKTLDQGSADAGIRGAVDHPVYPLAIVAAHRFVGGDGPFDWQASAQIASIVASLLLIVPLYLIARELFGDRAAFPACLLTFSVPVTVHVFADTLSESTFLLFWSWGLWGALRFFKNGSLRMIPLIIAGSALAYLTRPEGLLLPAAVFATLVLSPRWVLSRLPSRRAAWVLGSLPIALGLLIGPYIAIKGGLGTKPSIARLLGTAPKSDAFAVERQRPLDPDQTAFKTLAIAAKTVSKAIVEAVGAPLAVFAVLGLILVPRRGDPSRQWTLLGVIGVASFLALLRLHATGGYCTSRHALILAMIGFGAAAFGLDRVVVKLSEVAWPSLQPSLRQLAWPLAFAALFALEGSSLVDRLNPEFGGYRTAGQWLAEHASDQNHVVDVTGWSQFYGGRPAGYTFANLIEAPGDPAARWVVVREAHLKGPWLYCRQLSTLVDGLKPVATFYGDGKRPTRVYVFDRAPKLAEVASKAGESSRKR